MADGEDLSKVNQAIGARIRERRLHLSLHQKDFAERLGMTHQAFSKYERGLTHLTCSSLYVIAETLGVNIEYFFQDLPDTTSTRSTPPHALKPEILEVLELMTNLSPEIRKALATGLVGIKDTRRRSSSRDR